MKCLENELLCKHSRADKSAWISSGYVAHAALSPPSQLLLFLYCLAAQPWMLWAGGSPFLPCPEEEEEEKALEEHL